jgi:hypothetical protein
MNGWPFIEKGESLHITEGVSDSVFTSLETGRNNQRVTNINHSAAS